jgi:hypothetical protein
MSCVQVTSSLFSQYLDSQPIAVTVSGGGNGTSTCWAQRFLDGVSITRTLNASTSSSSSSSMSGVQSLFSDITLRVIDLTTTTINASLTLDAAVDLKVRGPLPDLDVGMFDATGNMLLDVSVTSLQLDDGAHTASIVVNVANNAALAGLAGDAVNGVAGAVVLQLIGNTTLALIAAQFAVSAPFNGYVDPTMAFTPAPTPAPPGTADSSLSATAFVESITLSNVGSQSLEVLGQFKLPDPFAIDWTPQPYTILVSVVECNGCLTCVGV